MLPMQAAHRFHDEIAGDRLRRRHPHHARQPVIQPLHLPLQLVGGLLHALGGGEGLLAGGGRHVARRGAQEQPGIQRGFQRRQPAAGRGLVNLQQRGGAAQGAVAVDRQENARVVPIHGRECPQETIRA